MIASTFFKHYFIYLFIFFLSWTFFKYFSKHISNLKCVGTTLFYKYQNPKFVFHGQTNKKSYHVASKEEPAIKALLICSFRCGIKHNSLRLTFDLTSCLTPQTNCSDQPQTFPSYIYSKLKALLLSESASVFQRGLLHLREMVLPIQSEGDRFLQSRL